MEIVEIAKELFENEDIRIYGTVENPLFVANDIGRVLGLKSIKMSIKDFDDTMRQVNTIYSNAGNRQMSLLTEKGLYEVLYKSRKPVAKKFKDWAYRVMKEIRLRGRYDLGEQIDKQVAADAEEQVAITEPKEAAMVVAPVAAAHCNIGALPPRIDINDYTDKPYVYLFRICANVKKFGISTEIEIRKESHLKYFRKLGHQAETVKYWVCSSEVAMRSTERCIKRYAKDNGFRSEVFAPMTEIIDMADEGLLVELIGKWVEANNKTHVDSFELEKIRLVNEGLRLQNEGLRLQGNDNCESLKLQGLNKDKDNEKIRLLIKLVELSGTSHD